MTLISKQGLMEHIPFIESMMEEHSGTELGKKFIEIHDVLSDPSRKLNTQQIKKISGVIKKYETIIENSRSDLKNEASIKQEPLDEEDNDVIGPDVIENHNPLIDIKVEEEEDFKEMKNEKENDPKTSAQEAKRLRELKRLQSDIVQKESPVLPPRRSLKRENFENRENESTKEVTNTETQNSEIEVKAENDNSNPSVVIQENSDPKLAALEAKRQRELRKLQLNIVHDHLPLPSRRVKRRTTFGEDFVDPDETLVVKKKPRTSLSNPDNDSKNSKDSFESKKRPNSSERSIEEPSVKTHRKSIEAITLTDISTKKVISQNNVKKKKKTSKSLTKKLSYTESDDEWEDIDEDSNSNSKSSKSFVFVPESIHVQSNTSFKKVLKDSEPSTSYLPINIESKRVIESSIKNYSQNPAPPTRVNTYDYKIIENVAFARCTSHVSFRCMVDNCKFQSHHKHFYGQHATSRHQEVVWSGFCEYCDKFIMKNKNLSMDEELIHLKDHLSGSIPDKDDKISSSSNPRLNRLFVPPKLNRKITLPKAKFRLLSGKTLLNSESGAFKIVEDEKAPILKKMEAQVQLDKLSNKETDVNEDPFSELLQEVMKKCSTRFDDNWKKPSNSTLITSITVPRDASTNPTSLKNQNNLLELLSTESSDVIPPKPPQIVGKKISISSLPLLQSLNAAKNIKVSIGNVPTTDTSKLVNAISKSSQVTVASTSISNKVDATKKVASTSTDSSKIDEKNQPSTSTDNREKTSAVNDASQTEDQIENSETELLYHETLRPWLNKRTKKQLLIANQMKNANCLNARFKCMGSSCSFFTTMSQTFKRHLKLHELYTPNDKENYLQCSYCVFEAKSFEELLNHQGLEHLFDRFQCAYCFYRSFHDFHVVSHQNQYHKMKPRKIFISLPLTHRRTINEEIKKVEKNIEKFVPPITCVYCKAEDPKNKKAKFYCFKSFLRHLYTHDSSKVGKCSKCKGQSTTQNLYRHLINCHGFGLYQCAFCRFGTNTFEIISNHLANNHPSNLAMYCERTKNRDAKFEVVPEEYSINSIQLKYMTAAVESSLKLKPEHIEQSNIMVNKESIGILAPNIKIIMKKKEKPAEEIKETLSNSGMWELDGSYPETKFVIPTRNQDNNSNTSPQKLMIGRAPQLTVRESEMERKKKIIEECMSRRPTSGQAKLIYNSLVRQQKILVDSIKKKPLQNIADKNENTEKNDFGFKITNVISLSDPSQKESVS